MSDLSVVIPAHNEAAVIARLLTMLIETDRAAQLEIVVVTNGCTDDTAAVARAVSPRVQVIEIPQASKMAALNAGDVAAHTFPRAYVDADVRVTADALLAVAARLDDDPVRIGAPKLVVDVSAASPAIRRYYRIWQLSEYRGAGHVGSGVYVLSGDGRARFGVFPEIIADDRYTQQHFELSERVTLEDEEFVVPAPSTLRSLVRRGVRIASGNLQLEAGFPALRAGSPTGRFLPLIRRVAVRPSLWWSFATYCYGYAAPRIVARWLQSRGRIPAWNRDESSRTVV